ncbi:ATP-binding protein, partial [Actinacidiphila glaucinigra]|uniref:ATP-binding protein n=1 Tax=Actinacidiphila glaucinigra TaxID=235986 RepID=UPI003F556021
EGGRGLFLIAQLTRRWGTRYTADGKLIWAEQAVSRTGAVAVRQAGGRAVSRR